MKHLIFGPLDSKMRRKYERIWIAQQFPGWTLEYIDQLSYSDRQAIMAVVSAQAQYRQHKRNKK